MDKNAFGTDAYRTVFVGRLNYETSEETLRRAFDGIVGDVEHVHIVRHWKTGKSRGYAFVEFSNDREADSKFTHILSQTDRDMLAQFQA